MKKTITLRAATLAACIALTCTACGGGSQSAATTNAGSETKQAAQQEKPAQQEKQTQQEKPAAENPPTPENPNGCALAEQVNNEIPKTAPKVDQWVGIRGVGVPVSSTYGPAKREGDLFTCYQHSPTGALFAAAYVVPATTVKGFADEWTIPESRIHKEMKAAEATNKPSKSSNFRITGYQFNYYTPEETAVNISIEGNTADGSGNFNVLVSLKWQNGKWNFSPNFAEPMVTPLRAGNSSYIPWGANAS
ncbi:hypothetical protein ACUH9H_01120 [Dermabacteraceae bacterium P13128]